MSHWYDLDGNPCYTQPKANGKGERATTLRDARKLNLVPSVTTIMQVLAKPGLDVWKTSQTLEAAWDTVQTDKCILSGEEYQRDFVSWKKEVIAKSKESSEEAAIIGTNIHDALEEWFKTGKKRRGYVKYIDAVIECMSCLPALDWIAEESFADRRGFGGKVDLYWGVEALGEGIIIDFKTKASKDKFAIYDEHSMQLAAYARGLDIPDATCYNLFISIDSNFDTELVEHTPAQIERGWQMFENALQLWKLKNNFMV